MSEKFNPNEHLIQIKNRGGSADYLPVQWRLVWFREECPNGTIDTQEIEVDLDRETEEETYQWNNETRRSEKVIKRAPGYARFKAVVANEKGGRATGTKSEKAASFADFIEKAETGAIGRALAALGYGTQFTDEEFAEGERLADAPVERSKKNATNGNQQAASGQRTIDRAAATNSNQQAASSQQAEPDPQGPATEQQKHSLNKLYQYLEKAKPATEPATYQEAKDLIAELSQEYKQKRSAAKR